MKVQQWFDDGCNYQQGISIYMGLKKSQPNLIRLFKLKQNSYTTSKLKHELKKFKNLEVENISFTETSPTPPPQTPPPPPKEPDNLSSKYYKPLLINMLPVELHAMYIEQKKDFATACSLKMQLNNLAPEDENTALKLCLEIERLFDKIEAAWKVFDHYTETKQILKINTNSFYDLTPAQLLQRRNYKRSNLSKTKNKIKNLKQQLKTVKTKGLKTKVEVNLAKAKEKKVNLEIDINALSELINKK
jgi:hypothetical protein